VRGRQEAVEGSGRNDAGREQSTRFEKNFRVREP
jgi:hypothetical protein